jgi:hypothetical protein
MPDEPDKTIEEFCDKKRMSRSHFNNLNRAGRGPKLTYVGRFVRISAQAEADYDREIAENPIKVGLDRLIKSRGGAKSSEVAA